MNEDENYNSSNYSSKILDFSPSTEATKALETVSELERKIDTPLSKEADAVSKTEESEEGEPLEMEKTQLVIYWCKKVLRLLYQKKILL